MVDPRLHHGDWVLGPTKVLPSHFAFTFCGSISNGSAHLFLLTTMPLERLLYRELLRLGRHYDATGPALCSLIHRSTSYSPAPPSFSSDHEELVKGRYGKRLDEYLGGRERAMLPPGRADGLRVAGLVRSAFREKGNDQVDLDVGFLALKELSSKSRWGADMGLEADARRLAASRLDRKLAKMQQQPSSAAPPKPRALHSSEEVGPGHFLLAHPVLGDYFARSVIFLTSRTADGATGYLVNSPTQLDSFLPPLPAPLRARFPPTSMKAGGPRELKEYDEGKTLQMLYKGPLDFGGAEVGAGGVREGGDISLALEAVHDGLPGVHVSDFCFAANVSRWDPGQLETELGRGFWVPVEADAASVVFDNVEWQDIMEDVGFGEVARIKGGSRQEEREFGWGEGEMFGVGGEDEEAFDQPSNI